MQSSATIRTPWGEFTTAELRRFSLLALIFFFTIGIYWMLRPLKDGVFNAYVGAVHIPWAKFVSLGVVVPLVWVYGKLVDAFPRHRVFYALSVIYAVGALVLGLAMLHPSLGIEAVIPKEGHPLFLGRLIGWISYVYAESFGSIMVVLFWSFAADTTTPEAAKRGFPIVGFGAQIGGILGPLLVATQAEHLGLPVLLMIGSVLMLFVGLMVALFMYVIPSSELSGYQAKGAHETKKDKKKASFIDGLMLMLKEPYLMGIFAIVTLFEVIVTIFDYYFKYLSSLHYTDAKAFTAFQGMYGVYVCALSALCIFLDINRIGRKLGLGVALTIMPVIIGIFALIIAWHPTVHVAMFVMVAAKGLNYAFNQPSKEQLYIPTTPETKYKVKSFMEMFGSRGAKALGSVINVVKTYVTAESFILVSTAASLGMVGVWLYAALYVARKHKAAVSENRVVC